MAWRFHAIDATLSPWPVRASISTQAGTREVRLRRGRQSVLDNNRRNLLLTLRSFFRRRQTQQLLVGHATGPILRMRLQTVVRELEEERESEFELRRWQVGLLRTR